MCFEFYNLKVTFKLVGLTSKCDCVAIFALLCENSEKNTNFIVKVGLVFLSILKQKRLRCHLECSYLTVHPLQF
eukprot:UN02914